MFKFITDNWNLCWALVHNVRNFADRSLQQKITLILLIVTVILGIAVDHATARQLSPPAADVQQENKHSVIRSSKPTLQPVTKTIDSATKTNKSLKRVKQNKMHCMRLGRSALRFVEVEIVLNDNFNIEYVSSLPRAPGSDLEVLDSPKRVRVQLPVSEAKALVDEGIKIDVLRKFILVEGLKREADKQDGVTTTLGTCSGSYSEGSNDTDVDIPDDDGWVYSDIYISTAPGDATVTCIDVHYEIIHSWVGDLDVDLTDEDLSYEYDLWENEGGSADNINETETGITMFNGELVNQIWTLWARDTEYLISGYIDYWWIKVYYEEEAYNYYIQADSHPDNTIEITFMFDSYPGRVYFSRSPSCGTLNPSYDDPVSCDGYYCVSTEYTPCEAECSYVTVLAEPTYGSNQIKTIHLDDRQHIWCCADSWERELGVLTFDEDTGECAQAYVTVTVIPTEAGSVDPSSGYSYWNGDCYVFYSTYTPSCSYSGRVRVRFHTSGNNVIFSFEQNATLTPSSSWQTVSDSFCSEGMMWMNYYQVYRMYLSASKSYNFSLCENDGVGASCSGNGDLTMYNSACSLKWYINGASSCGYDASTLGTSYEDWSPPSTGYYYLEVSEYSDVPMSYTLAYRQESDTDVTPPEPDPMEWDTEPCATSTSSISMVAIAATDTSPPIYYQFDFVDSPTGGSGGTDSGWQTSTTYTDSGLQPNHQYRYRVHARDSAPGQNTNTYSTIAGSYTYANSPGAASFSNVTQTTIQANWTANGNSSGTQYLCENITKDTNSGWTSNTYWNESGLNCGTEYCYRIQARNSDGVKTEWTDLDCQTTLMCEIPPMDLNNDGVVNFSDFAIFAFYWMDDTCSDPDWCEGSDSDYSGRVDFVDLLNFVDYWLWCRPDLDSDGDVDFADFALFANHWMEQNCVKPSWCETADLDRSGEVDFTDLKIFTEYWLEGIWWPIPGDLNGDSKVNFADFALFADNWLETDCEESNNWCERADLDKSGSVDLYDLGEFADNWLKGF
jgi:hypothetical protein